MKAFLFWACFIVGYFRVIVCVNRFLNQLLLYWLGSTIDNFEWSLGNQMRFGLVAIDNEPRSNDNVDDVHTPSMDRYVIVLPVFFSMLLYN
jgi:hypothetical protein